MDSNTLLQFINEIAPKHDRTSCDDNNLNGNQYFNEYGYPRCNRCALLHRWHTGEWSHNAIPRIAIKFTNHPFIKY